MSRVAVIAQMNVDMIFAGFPGFPLLGEEVFAERFEIQLGGGPQVLPILLSRMGIPSKLGTFLGDDLLSRFSLQLLEQEGFHNVHNLYRGKGKPVVITSVFSFPEDRSFLAYNERASDADLSDQEVYDFLKGSQVCFAPQSEAVLKKLKQDGTIIVYDVGWSDQLRLENYKHILRHTDVFVPNDKEAMKLTDTATPQEALRCLGEYVKYPVVKTGKSGCMALLDGEIVRVGAVEHLIPVDTTGAGDNFLAGIIYGICQGWDMVKSLQMANVMGGYSTLEMGCFKANITVEKAMELMKYYEH